ncbi:hypothetical protein ACS0TY_029024 [Phlomoides rotata]
MGPGTDAIAFQGNLENGFCREHEKVPNSENKTHEDCDDSAQAKAARPPLMRHCSSQATLADPFSFICPTEIGVKSSGEDSGFQPTFRSGCCSEIGPKQYMEDEYICLDDLSEHLGTSNGFPTPGAFYGVFDGHGGKDAASFTRENILKFITEDSHFPDGVKRALKNAFVRTDHALADHKNLDRSSGTTAIIALILGRTLIIANAGDSRAVLGKRGRAIELSKDHKPNCTSERLRIEKLGGVIYDGYLNGQLSVARALGDWHMKGPKGSQYPLSSEPELEELVLTEEDEFLIIGCDGLWDVMSSQYAVTIVRKELMAHNDPERCSSVLVKEALKRNTCDNLTVVVICFSRDPPPTIEIPRSHKRRSISAEGLDLLKGVLSNA